VNGPGTSCTHLASARGPAGIVTTLSKDAIAC